MTFWTDERVAELKHLHADGLSASQIAAELHAPSRNAVIGKLSRLGINGGGMPKFRKPRVSASIERRGSKNHLSVFRARERAEQHRQRTAEGKLEPLRIKPRETDVARVSILDLTSFTCRFPVGEPGTEGFGYCGNGVKPGSVYCDDHHARAYSPAALRPLKAPQESAVKAAPSMESASG